MATETPIYSPPPAGDHQSIADATDVRNEHIEQTDRNVHAQIKKGNLVSISPPSPLQTSGRVLVATFLLPYEATIDLEEDRSWVPLHPLFPELTF